MSFTFSFTGTRQMKAKLQAVGRELRQAEKEALTEEGRSILDQSQALVPIDTGTLKSSGYVTDPKENRQSVSIKVGYGKGDGDASNYAIPVHENPDGPVHEDGRGPKYLEKPFNAAENGMIDRLADKIKKVTEG